MEWCKISRGRSCDFSYDIQKQSRFFRCHLLLCHYRTRLFIIWRYFQMMLEITFCSVSLYIPRSSMVICHISLLFITVFLTLFILLGFLIILSFASWHFLSIAFAFLRYETYYEWKFSKDYEWKKGCFFCCITPIFFASLLDVGNQKRFV